MDAVSPELHPQELDRKLGWTFQGLLEMRKCRFMKAKRKRHGPAFKAKVAMEALKVAL
ncbi:MAG TPA: hypothetical protein VEC99_13140 [Clostridia bacterium]|nr:hypothetical protein [Clostridia bacterium]